MSNPDYKFYLVSHGLMHPDYFQGTSGVQLNVSIHNEHTVSEVIDLINDEIDTYYDILFFTVNEKGHDTSFVGEKIDNLIDDLRRDSDLNKIFYTNAPTKDEYYSDEEASPYIFSIEIADD
jgi:hypothetical protein